MSKRDSGIELARIYACLSVIGVHTSLATMFNDAFDFSRGYFNCLFADGVGIFWFICGAFFFVTGKQVNNVKLTLKRLKKLIIPMILFQIFALFFWLRTESVNGVIHESSELLGFFKDIIILKTPISKTGHLWYCCIYILVILAFPVLNAFVGWIDEKPSREKWFCAITLLLLIWNDYSDNKIFIFSHYGASGLVPASILVIWGHIIYKNRHFFYKINTVVLYFVGILSYFGLNALRMYINYKTNSTHILYWYSSIGVICTAIIILLCGRIRISGVFEKIVLFVTSSTFYIYLIHVHTRYYVREWPLVKDLLNKAMNTDTSFASELKYTSTVLFSVFGCSFVVAGIIQAIVLLSKKFIIKKAT